MSIKQSNKKSAIFVTTDIFYIKALNLNQMCEHLIMSMNLIDIPILIIKGPDYCYIISGISKNEAMKLLQDTDLAEKKGTL